MARFDRNQDRLLDEEERKLAQELLGDGDTMQDGIVASNPLRVLVNLEKNVQARSARSKPRATTSPNWPAT